MLVYAGIDEAGYGPMFGPLVIARSVFVLADAERSEQPPCLWRALSKAVCRKASDKRRRVAVSDSKQLYTPAKGLGHLERGVLAFASLAGCEPGRLDDLLAAVAYDAASRQPDQLWYLDEVGGPTLPHAMDSGRLTIARSQVRRAAEAGAVKLASINAAILYEDRFNHMVQATRSKARCSWTFIAGHLRHIWQQFGEHEPIVVLDRQGGRQHYRDDLALEFDAAAVDVLGESPLCSAYRIVERDRAMRVIVQTDSEAAHLPVALASMTAKYLRELLMSRFNAYWRAHAPTLRPTAGYTTDGRRFLRDIQPVIQQLGLDPATLIRSC